LIPAGYTGPVVIVFDAPDGQPSAKQEGGALVFNIGSNGVLRLKTPPPEPGLVLLKYFYVGSDGTRQEIPDKGNSGSLQVFNYPR
jgi:hypothetical protein